MSEQLIGRPVKFLINFFFAATTTASSNDARIEPAFKPYVIEFIEEAKKRGVFINPTTIDIRFVDRLYDDSIGLCEIGHALDPINRITIARSYWKAGDHWSRETLVFHELAHCTIGRDHCNKTFMGDPISMMTDYVQPTMYASKRKYYLDELFDRHPACPGDVF